MMTYRQRMRLLPAIRIIATGEIRMAVETASAAKRAEARA